MKKNKRKQVITILMTIVLSIATAINPVTMKAQENSPIIEKEIAPAIVLPGNLKAKEGTPLKEIQLPEQWTWTDERILVSKDTREYSACLKVDDETYNYETIEGYNPEKHDVEVLLTVIIEEPELTNPIQKAETPTTLADGDVEINDTNFQDVVFREYLKNDSTINPDGNNILTAAEIATVFKIDVSNKKEITDLTGIDNFFALTSLNCSNTQIKELNVSSNFELTTLNCSNTPIDTLDISSNYNLATLNCSNTKITKLDVSSNSSLTELNCSNTPIDTLNVRKNEQLVSLDCSSTGVSALDVSQNTTLSVLRCYGAKITSLDVSGNEELTTLDCSNTPIEELIVSNNSNLNFLNCSSTGITDLNVRNNEQLFYLDCTGTKITSLDVRKNEQLMYLYCGNTNITSLDVSGNTALTFLFCPNTPLAYLNLGNNAGLTSLNKPSETVMELKETGTSFNISKKFQGFDISKVLSIEGATYDATTGIVSNYNLGTPIVYVYDCGTANNVAQTLKVTLTSVGESTITFNDELSKDYDGTAVTDKPDVTVTGSKGPVTYTWEKQNGSNWDTIATAPTDAGTYRVSAKVEADANYKEATTTQEFTISQATNSWTEELSLTGWTYNETTNTPSATAKFGDVVFIYSDKQDGTYTDTIPTDAGTYYVKASVVGSDNYTGLESIKTFVIEPKNTDDIKVSEINKDTKLEEIIVNDGNTTLVIGKDYDITKKQEGNQVTVTITLKGNYTGTITQTYTIEPDKPNKPTEPTNENKQENTTTKTGDTTNIQGWIMLMIGAVGVMVVVRKKKKEETEE